MIEITQILDERGKKYGSFADRARMLQGLRQTMAESPGWALLRPDQKEALGMIQDKITRILAGGAPDYEDNWTDIAGYATLVRQDLQSRSPPRGPQAIAPMPGTSATAPEDIRMGFRSTYGKLD